MENNSRLHQVNLLWKWSLRIWWVSLLVITIFPLLYYLDTEMFATVFGYIFLMISASVVITPIINILLDWRQRTNIERTSCIVLSIIAPITGSMCLYVYENRFRK